MKKEVAASALSMIRRQYKQHVTGMISAVRTCEHSRSAAVPYSEDEPLARNRDLRAYLISKGYGLIRVVGRRSRQGGSLAGRQTEDTSFFVIDLRDKSTLVADLIQLGSLFEQDYVTVAEAGGDYFRVPTNRGPDRSLNSGQVEKRVKLGKPSFAANSLSEVISQIVGRPDGYELISVDTGVQSSSYVDGVRLSVGQLRSCHHFAKRVAVALTKLSEQEP